jgi:hypothetical protein
VLLGGRLFMKLEAGIAGSALGEQLSSAHRWGVYAKARRLTLGLLFGPEPRETFVKARRSEPVD